MEQRFAIYILFRDGDEGYFNGLSAYDEIKYTKDNTRCYMAPTHSIALSKAKWLRREFANIVGRTEIIPFLLY